MLATCVVMWDDPALSRTKAHPSPFRRCSRMVYRSTFEPRPWQAALSDILDELIGTQI